MASLKQSIKAASTVVVARAGAFMPLLAVMVSLLAVLWTPAAAAANAGGTAAPQAAAPGTFQDEGAGQGRADLAYRVGANDVLRVSVYGHEDLKQQVLVQADGTFSFPLVGHVPAAGSTITELERALADRLGRGFIRNPQVTVVVQEYRSQIVYVIGEVQRPGTFPLTGSTSLVEILARAGPMSANAAAEVLVVRPPAGTEVAGPTLPTPQPAAGSGSEVIRVDMRDLQAGATGRNIPLLPNDTVFVPQAPKVFVSGEVRNPGAYGFFPGMTARQLISVAGGLTQYGSEGRLQVVRTLAGKTDSHKQRLDDPVRPGDTLVVRRRLF